MINQKALKGLFKPHTHAKKNIVDLFQSLGVSKKKFWKIQFEQECSKATDETCINAECRYNFLSMHQTELYIDLMQEIQAERKAVEDRNKRDRKKYGYV